MINPFFTIIIPIYNNISFISASIKSLLQQSFHDFEIILIDDGSTDGSYELCKKFLVNKSSITLLHQPNSGAGSARNLGLEHAKGEYICFFDIDDKVRSDWLENIYKLVNQRFPELIVYSYREINPALKTKTSLIFKDRFYENNDSIKETYVSELSGVKFNNGFVWNKVYRRELLINKNIKFPSLRIQQDEVFNHEVYKNANSLLTSSEILYDYYVYDKGNTRNSYIPERLKIFEEVKSSFFAIINYWQLKNSFLDLYIHSRFVRNSIYNRNPFSLKHYKSYIKNLISNYSLNESALFLLDNSKEFSRIEKLFLQAIAKKSILLFLLADFSHISVSKAKALYHKMKN